MSAQVSRVGLGFSVALLLAMAVFTSAAFLHRSQAASDDRVGAGRSDAAACLNDSSCTASLFQPSSRPTLTLGITPSDVFPSTGDSLVYTIALRNAGTAAAPGAVMTNTLPAGLDYNYTAGTLQTTAGSASYDTGTREIRWRGDLGTGASVTLTYAASLAANDFIYNLAVITHPLALEPAGAVSGPVDEWTAPEVVGVAHYFHFLTMSSGRHIAVDAAGAPHIAYGGNGLYYATRGQPGGAWLLETIVPTQSLRPAMLLDAADQPVIAFASAGALQVARRTAVAAGDANGDAAPGWSVERVATAPWVDGIAMARGGDGRLHLVYQSALKLYYTVGAAGAWISPTEVITSGGWTADQGFSLALDSAGVPHVVCVLRLERGAVNELRLYRPSGSAPWSSYEVAVANNETKPYSDPSLVFDGTTPHVSFFQSNKTLYHAQRMAAATRSASLSASSREGSAVASNPRGGEAVPSATWQVTQLAARTSIFNETYSSLAVRGGRVAVAYAIIPSTSQSTTDIRLASRPLAGGTWIDEAVESFVGNTRLAFPSLALDVGGRGHLAYYYGPDEGLRYAGQTASFAIQTIDRAETRRASALAIGADATVHVAYLTGGLHYAAKPNGGTTWASELAVPSADGTWLDLAVDTAGTPHATYAISGGLLFHAARAATGLEIGTPAAWPTAALDRPGALQPSPAIAAEMPGTAHIAYLALNAGQTVLRHAGLAAGRWSTETLAAVGAAAPPPELVAQGGQTYVFYADCTAAGTGTYAIPLRLATSAGSGWQTRTLDTFQGACDTSFAIRLHGSDTGDLVATAGINSPAMSPTTLVRFYWLTAAGDVMHMTASPGGIEEAGVPASASSALGIQAVANPTVLSGQMGVRGSGIINAAYDWHGKNITYQIPKDGKVYSSALVRVYVPTSTVAYPPIDRNALAFSGWTAAVAETFSWDPPGTLLVEMSTCSGRGCNIAPAQAFISPAPKNVPAPTDTPTCRIDPSTIVPCNCGQSSVTFSAIDRPSCCGTCRWNFYQWTGTCGARGNTPMVQASCPSEGMCNVIAEWVRPLLGVSGTPAPTDYCASKQNGDTGVLGFELCANAVDDWQVGGLTFQASGSGKDDQEIDKVRLTLDGKTVEGKYTADNGTIAFAVGVTIGKGECKAGSLTYSLKQLACPLCEDPVKRTGCKEAKDFSVSLSAANVSAAAKTFPYSKVIGSANGGPVTMACIKNGNTTRYFYEIQKAIDDPATQDGHTIWACPGTYTENVNLAKSLAVRSTDGRGVTTVQAADTKDHVFEITGGMARLEGFTLKGASGAEKAGVYLSGGSAKGVEVVANMITGNGLGVFVQDAESNTIGGTSEAERNIISGNSSHGMGIAGAQAKGNKVQGNFIGTTESGVGPLANGGVGVYIYEGSNNVIGGTTKTRPDDGCHGACNVISSNGREGVKIDGSQAKWNQVRGNFIGTSLGGSYNLGNGADGLLIDAAPENTIGGSDKEARNIISGNKGNGVTVRGESAKKNTIAGNYIGTM